MNERDIAPIIYYHAIVQRKIFPEEMPTWDDLHDHDRDKKISIKTARHILNFMKYK